MGAVKNVLMQLRDQLEIRVKGHSGRIGVSLQLDGADPRHWRNIVKVQLSQIGGHQKQTQHDPGGNTGTDEPSPDFAEAFGDNGACGNGNQQCTNGEIEPEGAAIGTRIAIKNDTHEIAAHGGSQNRDEHGHGRISEAAAGFFRLSAVIHQNGNGREHQRAAYRDEQSGGFQNHFATLIHIFQLGELNHRIAEGRDVFQPLHATHHAVSRILEPVVTDEAQCRDPGADHGGGEQEMENAAGIHNENENGGHTQKQKQQHKDIQIQHLRQSNGVHIVQKSKEGQSCKGHSHGKDRADNAGTKADEQETVSPNGQCIVQIGGFSGKQMVMVVAQENDA